mgnify:FL=1
MSRMERYVDNDVKFKSRAEKNRDLYNNLGRLEKYTSISDVSKIEAVELNDAKKNYQTREGYHKIKDYDIKIDKPLVRKELDDFNYLYNDTNKTYDINRVLEEAKDLREKDALEKRRKLNNEKYNILESSEEELAKFKEEAKLRHKPIENEKELEELINTITSKELRKQIDDATEKNSLLSDLMATSALEEVVEPIATKIDDTNITKKEENLDKKVTKLKEKELATEIDNSFYTKSLDLSKEDFDDDFEMVKSSKFVSFLKFIFSVILIGAVGFLVYYVITNF